MGVFTVLCIKMIQYISFMYLNELQLHYLRSYFRTRKYIRKVVLYGSYAQGSAGVNSDIDLLVEIDYDEIKGHAMEFFTISSELMRILNTPVSIVTTEALSPHIAEYLPPRPLKHLELFF
jgi:uncharacterized protein